jgi:hypothetical protein
MLALADGLGGVCEKISLFFARRPTSSPERVMKVNPKKNHHIRNHQCDVCSWVSSGAGQSG